MVKEILIILLFLLCISCGVKNDPEYKSLNKNNKIIKLV
jgi:hypothetical protein|tara:strand:+ start:541 stop:657 length:117 start_codon:yes stop_codon:yes gene_type:complete